jgi:hypothetical protein
MIYIIYAHRVLDDLLADSFLNSNRTKFWFYFLVSYVL